MASHVVFTFAQWIAVIWYIAVYIVRALGLAMHIKRTRRCGQTSHVSGTETGAEQGVTILRPMKGVEDADLYECLRSTFVQRYPRFQVFMCVSDPQDPAIVVAKQLMREFPHIEAEILVGPDREYGINPKVNNLVKGYEKARYDIIWTLDSNITVHPDALLRAVPEFRPNIKLVHHLPVAIANTGAGWGGILDETYMLTAHSTFYSGINFVGIAPCVTGKSNMYRRSDLDSAVKAEPGCGLEKFANYMAEDQMISEALWGSGGKTAMAPDAAVQPLGAHIDLQEFWWRRARWIRLRKYMVTSATLVEPFTDCFFHTMLFAVILKLRPASFLILCCAWLLVDWFNYRVLFGYTGQAPRKFSKFALSWLAREALAFPLWLWAMLGHRIWWRNRPYKIRPDLTAVPAEMRIR